MINFNPTRKEVLAVATQQQIMEWATGMQLTKKRFPSPLRRSDSPTCGFKVTKNGKLFLVDYKEDRIYDCFDVISVLAGVDHNGAVQIAADHFIGKKPMKLRYFDNDIAANLSSDPVEIGIVRRDWNKVDIKFWLDYGITLATLKLFRVYPLRGFYVNKVYFDCSGKLAFAYRLGHGLYQIYMPYNKKGKKFLTNHRAAILGQHVVEGMDLDFMFNQKSMKDIMVLFEMGYYSVAPIGESTRNPDILDTIDSMANIIVNFYDFDLAGIRATNYLRKKYGWGYVFLTNGRFGSINYNAKDISDYVKIHGMEAGKNIIEHLLKLNKV